MLLVINICTYINPLLAEQSYAGERQTSQTQSTLPACDSSEYSVKSRRFHFAEVMLTYIISCEITKIVIFYYTVNQAAAQLLPECRALSPLPPQTKQTENHTLFEGVYHEKYGAW